YRDWGAAGKVIQLEARYPQLRAEPASSSLTCTIDTTLAQFDALTVVRASQTLSSEINLPNLIQKLMRLAIEHAGAERGLLIGIYDHGPCIDAQAKAGPSGTDVSTSQEPVSSIHLPVSVLQYVLRTHERVLMDDASSAPLE